MEVKKIEVSGIARHPKREMFHATVKLSIQDGEVLQNCEMKLLVQGDLQHSYELIHENALAKAKAVLGLATTSL